MASSTPTPAGAPAATRAHSGFLPGLCLACGVFPVALVQKSVLPWAPEVSLQTLLPYYCVVLLLWGAYSGWSARTGAWRFGWPVWGFMLVMGALQAFATYSSAVQWAAPGMVMVRTYGHLLLQIGLLLLQAAAMRLVCGLPGGGVWLARGALCALCALLAVCALQAAWVLTGPDVRATFGTAGASLAGVHDRLAAVLAWCAAWFEAQSPFLSPSLYAKGSYTLTTRLPSGLFEESATLVASLALFGIPLLWAGMAVGKTCGKWVCRFGLCLVLLVLACEGSVGAMLTGGLVVAWSLRGLPMRLVALGRIYPVHTAFLVGIACSLLAIAVHFMDTAQMRARFDPARYTEPEQVVARAYWQVTRAHPLTGTGYGWSTPAILASAAFREAMTRGPGDVLKAWNSGASPIPVVSLLLFLFAECGLPLILALKGSYLWLWVRLRRAGVKRAGREQCFASAFYGPYALATAVFVLLGIDWCNPLLTLPLFALWGAGAAWLHPPQAEPHAKSGTAPLISNSPDRPFTMTAGR